MTLKHTQSDQGSVTRQTMVVCHDSTWEERTYEPSWRIDID